MNILLLASHAVAEYDDLRMFTDLGYDVFAPGGYEVPSRSGEGIRPALPDAPHHPELVARLNEVRAERGEPGPAIDWGKAALHDDIIDWADVIICHHFPEKWVAGQWHRIAQKRVIWRTCGQSDPRLERFMARLRPRGLEIVRYSPAERRYFERVGSFAGHDALIRFGKYPDDYGPWHGGGQFIGNVTQDMVARGDATGYGFWQAATEGLPNYPAGKGSDAVGGAGILTYDEMLSYLRTARAYLYTGTRPASYTLGLIEAMLSGVPVISIGAHAWGGSWDAADLFETGYAEGWMDPEWKQKDGIYPILPLDSIFDDAGKARDALRELLEYPDKAATISKAIRARAIELFDVATVGAQWKAFLS